MVSPLWRIRHFCASWLPLSSICHLLNLRFLCLHYIWFIVLLLFKQLVQLVRCLSNIILLLFLFPSHIYSCPISIDSLPFRINICFFLKWKEGRVGFTGYIHYFLHQLFHSRIPCYTSTPGLSVLVNTPCDLFGEGIQ